MSEAVELGQDLRGDHVAGLWAPGSRVRVGRAYPEKEKGGRGKKRNLPESGTFSRQRLGAARSILRFSPELADKVFAGAMPIGERDGNIFFAMSGLYELDESRAFEADFPPLPADDEDGSGWLREQPTTDGRLRKRDVKVSFAGASLCDETALTNRDAHGIPIVDPLYVIDNRGDRVPRIPEHPSLRRPGG